MASAATMFAGPGASSIVKEVAPHIPTAASTGIIVLCVILMVIGAVMMATGKPLAGGALLLGGCGLGAVGFYTIRSTENKKAAAVGKGPEAV